MNVGEMMNLTEGETKALRNKWAASFRGTQEYLEMFPYLTNTEATEMCQQLSEIPKGHRSRGKVVGYYSNTNEERKLAKLRGGGNES